jgi:lipid-A-disaccharide synthase
MDEKAAACVESGRGTLMSPDLSALYPLGYLSSLAFGLRFAVQWLYSEAKGQSVVISPFWWLSLAGNTLLLTHALIQMQFHVAFVQAINAVISWRNLNLMRPESEQKSLTFTLALMGGAALLVFALFLALFSEWFRIPDPTVDISWGWHLIGFTGLFLFSSRFILQWWDAEKKRQSYLGPTFWWMSIAGGTLSILYFAQTHDPVNLIGPSLGMIPYVRNLMLTTKRAAT